MEMEPTWPNRFAIFHVFFKWSWFKKDPEWLKDVPELREKFQEMRFGFKEWNYRSMPVMILSAIIFFGLCRYFEVK